MSFANLNSRCSRCARDAKPHEFCALDSTVGAIKEATFATHPAQYSRVLHLATRFLPSRAKRNTMLINTLRKPTQKTRKQNPLNPEGFRVLHPTAQNGARKTRAVRLLDCPKRGSNVY